MNILLFVVIFFIVILTLEIFFRNFLMKRKIILAKEEAEKILDQTIRESETKKKEIILEGKDEIFELKQDAEKEITKRYSEISEQEKYIRERTELYDRKIESVEFKSKTLDNEIKKIKKNVEKTEEIKLNQVKKLEEISKMSCDQAKKYILSYLEDDLVHERALKISEYEQILNEEKNEISKKILSFTMQRLASEYVSQSSVTVVPLPNDDVKGRIIGREGRNIRSIETLTGIDLIIDDTPEVIMISSFDPFRREIAKRVILSLIADGRIHPSRIEEEFTKVKKELEDDMQLIGQKAVIEVGVRNISPDIIKILGKLWYRTSYGQNVLEHSIEVAHLSGMIAAELGVDVNIAKRCGLLHDIGKALSHESEGSHIEIGVEIAKRNKEIKEVIESIEFHHDNSRFLSCFVSITQTADTLSAARPGARRENIENYIKRLQKLEAIISEFSGVEKCYAIQAGREVRIIINPEKLNDDVMEILAKKISKKIESELTYPGQIKLNLIRESRAIEFAK